MSSKSSEIKLDHIYFRKNDINDINELSSTLVEKKIKDENSLSFNTKNIVHIRNQQRNGKKSITIVEGLPSNLNYTKIAKHMSKLFATNASIIKGSNKIIKLNGDFRILVSKFLVEHSICDKDKIKIHGI